MTYPAKLLVRRFHAPDPETVLAELKMLFARGIDFKPLSREPFRSPKRRKLITLGNLQLNRYDTFGGLLKAPSRDVIHVGFGIVPPKAGNLGGSFDGRLFEAVTGRPDEQFQLGIFPDAITHVMDMFVEPFIAIGRSMYGDKYRLDDTQRVDLGTPPGIALKRAVLFAYRELDELTRQGMEHLIAPQLEEMLSNLLVAALAPRKLEESAQAEAHSSGIVRRCMEMLDSGVYEQVSINSLARSLGVTTRALQFSFRKQLNTTPLAYLHHRRLHAARNILLAAGPGVNVQYVALTCQFSNLSRFSRAYRAEFGELPSQTLRNAMRRRN